MTMKCTVIGDHAALEPSGWVTRFGARVPAPGTILDVACGGCRHANWFAGKGHLVTAVDRERPAKTLPGVDFVLADIETVHWPFKGRNFAGVVVTNYLYRPLFSQLLQAVAPGGMLIYETFAVGNERYGRPTNPDYLLRSGELLELVRGQLNVIAFEDDYHEVPRPAMIQRIAARRPLG
jgi:SAM-dependent methyltransferase